MQFSMNIKSDLRLLDKYEHLEYTQEMYEVSKRYVVGRVQQNLVESIGADGESLEELPLKTIKAKIRAGNPYPAKPLVATGFMKNHSISAKIVDTNVVEVSVNAPERRQIAMWHAEGAGSLPIRRFVGIPPAFKDQIVRRFREFIRRRILDKTV